MDELEAFLKKHGCGATAEEFVEYRISETEGAISDDEAEAVAGGVYDAIQYNKDMMDYRELRKQYDSGKISGEEYSQRNHELMNSIFPQICNIRIAF